MPPPGHKASARPIRLPKTPTTHIAYKTLCLLSPQKGPSRSRQRSTFRSILAVSSTITSFSPGSSLLMKWQSLVVLARSRRSDPSSRRIRPNTSSYFCLRSYNSFPWCCCLTVSSWWVAVVCFVLLPLNYSLSSSRNCFCSARSSALSLSNCWYFLSSSACCSLTSSRSLSMSHSTWIGGGGDGVVSGCTGLAELLWDCS